MVLNILGVKKALFWVLRLEALGYKNPLLHLNSYQFCIALKLLAKFSRGCSDNEKLANIDFLMTIDML